MRQYTTPDQTAKLIELAFDRPKFEIETQLCNIKGQPLRAATIVGDYSIGELIEMLPENIAKQDEMPSTLNISLLNGEWCVEYADFLGADFSFRSVELIDAIFDMIVKLKEKGVI